MSIERKKKKQKIVHFKTKTVTKTKEHLAILEKYQKLRESFDLENHIQLKHEEENHKPLTKVSAPVMNLEKFDTKDIRTCFKFIQNLPCYFPQYKDQNFTLTQPLYHPVRQSQTHVWLANLGTPKY